MKDIVVRLTGLILVFGVLGFIGWMWDKGDTFNWSSALILPLGICAVVALLVLIILGVGLLILGGDFDKKLKEGD